MLLFDVPSFFSRHNASRRSRPGVGQVGEVVSVGEFLVGSHGNPPRSVGIEEDYQKLRSSTTFRRHISVSSWCSDPAGDPIAVR